MQKRRSSIKDAAAQQDKMPRSLLASETGGWKKKWKDRLPIGLIFPNSYAVGMSNLGFQLVYGLLNDSSNIVCERIFVPDNPGPPQSIESGRLVGDFPILLFSVSFEQDYLNLIKILLNSSIPPLAEERTMSADGNPARVGSMAGGGMPLIIGGGVACFMNPEPLAPFIDCFVIGEAEPVLPEIIALLLQRLQNDSTPVNRDDLLRELAHGYSCCYVPRLYNFDYRTDGRLAAITAEDGLPDRITKSILSEPRPRAAHSHILSSEAEFSELYMTELGRGCSRGCRFCAAGFVYRPPRLWPSETIINSLGERPATAKRVGLLGMEMVRPEDLNTIAAYLLKESCSLSFSSLRADVISPELIELLAASGLKSAAIAPDGGSERLRRVINKGITEGDVLAAAEALVRAGVANLKLYFMIGLPTEEDDDIRELVALTLNIKDRMLAIGSRRGKMSRMTLSVNCFIPKPWTPFQYHPFAGVGVLKKRIKYLRQELAGTANIRIKAEKPEKSLLQAAIALGDRRLGMGLLALARSDRNWRQVFKKIDIKPEDYCLRTRSRDELLPWEIIDHGIDKNYLWAEYRKGLAGKSTIPCDTAICKKCGVCNGR
jgi:radical SAM superfamily enzyme YgiQ (UPF0313 family)